MVVKLSVTFGKKGERMKKVYTSYKLSEYGGLKVDKIFSKLLNAKKYVSEERLKGGFYHFEEMEI